MNGSYAKLYAMVILVVVLLTGAARAEAQFDSVLGIPWGASAEEAYHIMAANGSSFASKFTHSVSGTPILLFKGSYAGYPAEFRIHFMNGQMWLVRTSIWDSDLPGRLHPAFNEISKLLTGKYCLISRNESYHVPDTSLPEPVPVMKYVWMLDGNGKKIELVKTETCQVQGHKMEGSVSVSYENVQLYEILKKKNL